MSLWACPSDTLCLSPPQPDHTTPVMIVLALPSGYNYSVFCFSPFFRFLSYPRFLFFSLALFLSAWLGLDTIVQAEGCRAVVFVFTAPRTPLSALWLWTSWGQGLWAGWEVGVVTEDPLASNPPTLSVLLFPKSSFLSNYFCLLSLPGQ